MKMSTKLKERFCKDCNISINIFQEPYFTDRLKLYDKFYGTLKKWDMFCAFLEMYDSEQDYFEDYNRVKDEAMDFIKSTEAYQRFNEEDMSQYAIRFEGIPSKDIYHPSNDGRTFISVDMKKANFSALSFYDDTMFGKEKTWEEFIGRFTKNKHIIDSKYIRQVILGNCNPRRHITYEKYLMDRILNILKDYISVLKVVSLSNDEIIYDVTDCNEEERLNLYNKVKTACKLMSIPLEVELFTLHRIEMANGYYKEIFKENEEKQIKFKCLDSFMMPFVLRHFLGEEVQDSDKVFYHNGLLAQFIEVPRIEVGLDGNQN